VGSPPAISPDRFLMEGTMVSIERILCPVDFSPDSRRALDYALTLSERFGAKVHVLHVVANTPLVDVIPSVGVGGIQPMILSDTDRQAVLEHLDAFVPEAAKKLVTLQVEDAADVRAEILAQAAEGKADLIVLGSHGRSGFEHLLLGSTTERVLRKAHCPVLVVPHAR
jgi:nucleotide-binding universal stress UspA family protein